MLIITMVGTKGTIYKITNNEDVYIGSTIQHINTRWNEHKTRCFNEKHKEYNKPLYQKIRNDGLDNWHIELIEELNNIDINELKDIERNYIQSISTLNVQKNKSGSKDTDEYKEYKRNYRTEYYECSCGSNIQRRCLNKHRQTNRHMISR